MTDGDEPVDGADRSAGEAAEPRQPHVTAAGAPTPAAPPQRVRPAVPPPAAAGRDERPAANRDERLAADRDERRAADRDERLAADRDERPAADRDESPAADDPAEDEEEEPFGVRSFLRELAVIVVTALVISVLVKTFLVQAFYIPSGSMENTLLVNDRVMVNKLDNKADEIHRGDIVVFRDPGGWLETAPRNDSGFGAKVRDALVFLGLAPAPSDDDLIKRVIGVGGDHVVCCDAQHRIMVNGVGLNESSYLYPGSTPSEQRFDVTVPRGYLWLMGDHRAVSEDSRAHHVDGEPDSGMVPVSDVIGRAFVIVWPLNRLTMLGVPATFDQAGLRSGSS